MADDGDAKLGALWEAGRAAWPEVSLDETALARHAERLAGRGGDHPDLYLACACTDGDARALAAFERRLLDKVPLFLRRMRLSETQLDEVRQEVREKLFVGGKVSGYTGRGPLEAWLRVVCVRTAVSLLRRAAPDAKDASDSGIALRSPITDPELGLLKARYRDAFRAAFQDALASLERRDRTLLRLHFLDGLGIDAIAPIYRTHRATAARWIARAKESLETETRRLLLERLRLPEEELPSLMALVRSQLDVSLARLLRTSGGDPGSKEE